MDAHEFWYLAFLEDWSWKKVLMMAEVHGIEVVYTEKQYTKYLKEMATMP